MKLRKVTQGLLSTIMSAVLLTGALPYGGAGTQVEAATAEEKTVAGLGTSAIAAPKAPSAADDSWKGSYVWYGKYDNTPQKYRVLTPKSYDYGAAGMLLESDSIIYRAQFDQDGTPNDGATKANEWKYSDVRASLNGSSFLNRANGFTTIEKSAINKSTIGAHALAVGTGAGQVAGWTASEYKNYVALENDQIFLLDVEDLSNSKYGYSTAFIGTPARVRKYNVAESWLMRSASSAHDGRVGMVLNNGEFDTSSPKSNYGLCPAFNVNTAMVLFSSVVSGKAGAVGAEYKLTLMDSKTTLGFLNGNNPTIEYTQESDDVLSGTMVNLNYTLTGANRLTQTRMSVLILDKEWDSTNSKGAKILYYGKMETSTASSIYYIPESGTASFRLPNGLYPTNWGRTFYVYMVAETVHGDHYTDFATVPVKLPTPDVSATKPTITSQPTDKTVTAGSTATFTVQANGRGILNYQWQSRKDANSAWANSGQSGAKTSTLSVAATPGLDGWQFRCIVTEASGNKTVSDPATLYIKLAITKQPQNISANAGETAKFTVAATGKATLTYQWQSRKDSSSAWANSAQTGANTATLSVKATAGLNKWQFRCIVTDGKGKTQTSNFATLTVKSAPLTITKQPVGTTAAVGNSAPFTITAVGTGKVSYQWQSRRNSSSAWSNSGQGGAQTDTLLVSTTAGLNGWQFRCLVSDSTGATLASNTVTLKVSLTAMKITQQPTNASVSAGSTAKFNVTVSGGDGNLTYQWQSRKDSSTAWSNSAQSGAKTANLSVRATAGLNGWQFRCVVKDKNGQTVYSTAATAWVH